MISKIIPEKKHLDFSRTLVNFKLKFCLEKFLSNTKSYKHTFFLEVDYCSFMKTYCDSFSAAFYLIVYMAILPWQNQVCDILRFFRYCVDVTRYYVDCREDVEDSISS